MKTLQLLSNIRRYSEELEKDGCDIKGGKYNLSAPVELRRIVASTGLETNYLHYPGKVQLSDYCKLRDYLIEFQRDFSLDMQEYIDELNEYIADTNEYINNLIKAGGVSKKASSLSEVRKAIIGKKIDVEKLNNCENKHLEDEELSFSFYIEEDYTEYLYSVVIRIDENKTITAIEPMSGQKLLFESERRVQYKPCRTKKNHYETLFEILFNAIKR